MFFTQLILNPRLYFVQRDLKNCYKMHQTIMAMFPKSESNETGTRSEFKVLYRIGINNRKNRIKILIQSKLIPNRGKLPRGYLLDDLGGLEFKCKEIEDIEEKIDLKGRYMFRLRANPTKKSLYTSDGKKRPKSKRIFLKDIGEQEKWLNEKSSKNGFQILDVNHSRLPEFIITPNGKQHGWKDENHIQLRGVEFNGILKITDKDMFANALNNGIGSGKTFGFGLLSIAPIKTL